MTLTELFNIADFTDNKGMLFNKNCMELLPLIGGGTIDLTLTDIPYDSVNRSSNGLRNLDKGKADILTFDLQNFLDELYRVTKGTIIIFCGMNQVSDIFNYFDKYAKDHKGTVRQLIWKKTNPSPMNGDYIYLSGIENAIWFKKKGSVFNAHCKSNVFEYPCGRSKLHPTEKQHDLLKDLILDNSNENSIIFDPCCGSGSHCAVAKENNRLFIGCELNSEYFNVAKSRFTIDNKDKV
jgi:site-specific DNA-methyltransferase (adenine-specific)